MKVVISGVNLVEGGTLKVFRECIASFIKIDSVSVICLVHKKSLFKEFSDYTNIRFIEFDNIKSSWIQRLKFEYIDSLNISKELSPDIWISMHDITPRVICENQFVYCHNPTPFYKPTYLDFKFSKKVFLFSLFYKYLYKINIKKNRAVIVQQSWIADSFKRWFDVDNVIVARPVNAIATITEHVRNKVIGKDISIFYPALPRPFKNIELLCEAMSVLNKDFLETYRRVQLFLTIDGVENAYSKFIYSKYSHLKNINFIGILSQEDVKDFYKKSDIIAFPSKLETWGLPISESKEYGLPIFLADLPYAKETLGTYDKVNFVDVNAPEALAKKIDSYVNGEKVFSSKIYTSTQETCDSWDELRDKVISSSTIT
jgi:glycosyltransferase involved in cell wall biosynthesis